MLLIDFGLFSNHLNYFCRRKKHSFWVAFGQKAWTIYSPWFLSILGHFRTFKKYMAMECLVEIIDFTPTQTLWVYYF
jgi:hypothetical protein